LQKRVIKNAQIAYKELLDLGVSKEQARSVLPISLETEFIWTGTFLAFVHMCNLRLKSDTQKETRNLVKEMLDAVLSLENNPFCESLKAFNLKHDN
jgi:thymidylate synthase (FAD)